VNVLNLPLSAQEGYLFSRIDGVLTVDELSETLGFPQEALIDALRKLQELGAIEIVAAVAVEEPAAGQGSSKRGQKRIDPDLKMRVMSMKLALERYNYYQVLGVSPTAERSNIRAAYFALSKEFHPDVYYGQDLGKYRSMIEEIFARVTEAYETLSRTKKRAKYDAYIADQIRAWAVEKSLSGDAVADTQGAEPSAAKGPEGPEAPANGPPYADEEQPALIPFAFSAEPRTAPHPSEGAVLATTEPEEREPASSLGSIPPGSPVAHPSVAADEPLPLAADVAPPIQGQRSSVPSQPVVAPSASPVPIAPATPSTPVDSARSSFSPVSTPPNRASVAPSARGVVERSSAVPQRSGPSPAVKVASRPLSAAPASSVPAGAAVSPGAPRPESPKLGQESATHRRLRRQRGRDALQALMGKGAAPRRPSASPPVELKEKSGPLGIVVEPPPESHRVEEGLAYRYAAAALEALHLNDLSTAVNSFQLASSLAPDNEIYSAALEKVRTEAQDELSKTYERQARYEEEAGKYLQAADSLDKALRFKRDDPTLLNRAALNLLRGDGNLNRALEYARLAVGFKPKSAEYRLTLAELHLKLGERRDAERELAAAQKLEPDNRRVARLIDVAKRHR
jgi:tetratricopeptide (TPR) repeat protein/DNA-binding Lrp family transcriptional regulator